MEYRYLLTLFVLFGMVSEARAQVADTLSLPEVRIEATRGALRSSEAPMAYTVLVRDTGPQADPDATLQRALSGAPGLWVRDRQNASQGERILLRGVGWRSAFGVRGLSVRMDGIPLTMPDGQAILDGVEPSTLYRAEVLRGPAAFFGGNGSAGVLSLSSRMAPPDGRVALRLWGGPHETRQGVFQAGWREGGAVVSRISSGGERQFSAYHLTRVGVQQATERAGWRLSGTVHLHQLDGDNPGAVTPQEFAATPFVADPRSITQQANKQSRQAQAGVRATKAFGPGVLEASVHGTWRDLYNRLAFAVVDFKRLAGGGEVRYLVSREAWDLHVGAELGLQRDNRRNRANQAGVPGNVTLEQQERVQAAATYASVLVRPAQGWVVFGGMRVDGLAFALEDRFLSNGDASGDRSFVAVSPSFGIARLSGAHRVFANLTSSFETPTTTELVNRADGGAGLNPALNPERTRGLEAGWEAAWTKVQASVVGYVQQTTGRIDPRQAEDRRTYFTNGQDARGQGVEAGLALNPIAPVRFTSTLQWSRFTFDGGPHDGKALPGIPDLRGSAGLQVRAFAGWLAEAQAETVSRISADDASTVFADAYTRFDVRLHSPVWRFAGAGATAFVAVNNVTDVRYVASIIVNAASARFFEPGPGRQVLIGMRLSL